MIKKLEEITKELRNNKPLILNLTNFVTMDFVANSLLAIGAAPIVSNCEDELEELLNISSALYINIGTLDRNFISLIKKATAIATQIGKPIILDPVGAGATNIRTDTAKLASPFCNIIRGNSSEILSLHSNIKSTYGVEAVHSTDDAKLTANSLAIQNKATIIVSGPVDYITNGSDSFEVPFGSDIMPLVTGMGCCMTAVIAAFQSVITDPFEASVNAALYFALCGEIASLKHQHPGNFKAAFLDQLSKPDFSLMENLYTQLN